MREGALKILLVEDDIASRFMMSEMLDDIGADCFEASDGQVCIDVLSEQTTAFDVVLMDLHMPRKSGLEALKEIRSFPRNPPRDVAVIAVTADEGWHDLDRAQAVGFDDVLEKPVSRASVQRALARFAA